jgi:hypothetical protein
LSAAVNGDDADPDQPRAGAQRQHLAEQVADRILMARPEPRDRRMIRAWLAVMTRNVTSSRQPRSIAREDRTPIAYAYNTSATIIAGSCAARPWPSWR